MMMDLDGVLKALGLKESEVRFFYMNTQYVRPLEVKIISSTRRGNCEIVGVNLYQSATRQPYGTLVDMYGLWIKTPTRFKKIRELLREVDAFE